MHARTWPWLRDRILGLLSTPVHLDPAGNPVFRTRLQARFLQPPEKEVS